MKSFTAPSLRQILTSSQILSFSDIYQVGHGAHTYRIPALVVSNAGTLLAFAEARRKGKGDTGDIDLVVRRSTDGGDTWGEIIVVWADAGNTCGNPAPVVETETGRIWLPMTWNLGTDHEREIIASRAAQPRRPYITYSDDDGQTWASAQELPALRQPHWGWYATGPGNSIQIANGEYAGRIVVPANHSDTQTGSGHYYRSHVFFSDDGGNSWELGGTAGPATNEATVVERADSSLVLNMRSYAGQACRAISVSKDGGVSWTDPVLDRVLIDPLCQASMVRYDLMEESTKRGRILFANPASTKRERLTLRISTDDGNSWNDEILLYPGSAAYSSIAGLPDGSIGILFERDDYTCISFMRLTIG